MGTQKGADLTALELCRGSSGDVEGSLEKSTSFLLVLGEESFSGSKHPVIEWIFYCVKKKRKKNLCFELLLIVTVQLKGQT